ncbi:MAG TPA: hypothetical protein VFP94_00670, partial [Terriglobales bacterium]|nr:hypothetical protein [Terriglobales bacterium]
VVRQLTSTAISAHFNNLEFINSAGAWAAGSRRFAYGHVESAVGKIAVYDLQQQKVVRDYPIPGVGEVFNPTWSPDGRQIAFSAISGGLTNLYLLNLDNGAVRQLTNDSFAELQPAWSPDGRTLAFVTDRFTANLDELSHGNFRLALLDMQSGAVSPLTSTASGNQINPQWAPGGQSLYFISDADGIANLYEAPLAGGTPRQLTNLQTGISGITYLSPAMSVAQQTGDIIYSLYNDGLYSLVRLAPRPPAVAGLPAGLHPAILPPRTAATGAVAAMLQNFETGLAVAANFTQHPYHPTLHLDAIAPPSIAVGVGSYGTLLGGGTALHFSDLLNYHELTVAFESLSTGGGSGFVRNLSGSAVYLNHEHRWTWGLAGGQTPFVGGNLSAVAGTINGRPVVQTTTFTQWELDRDAVGILSYPFNRAQRLEFTGGYSNIGFAAETETLTEDLITGALIGDQRQDQPAPKALNFGVGTAALVYDTSIFGGVSPVLGQSYRFQAGINAGSIDFSTVLLDYRKYLSLARPVSLAGRLLHFGRYGAGADDPRLQPLFLGYPSIVRGYEFNSFSTSECGDEFQATGACPAFDRLLGSKIASASLEARFELLGALGILRTPQIPPVELAPFFDTGVAWTALDKPDFLGGNRRLVSSEGLTLRVNALGFAVIAIDYAIPNNRTRSHVWEFSFLPGY